MTTNCIPGPTPWPISWIPSRPTTGVRYITNSHLLEDVYSLNDFTYSDCNPDGTKLFKGRRRPRARNTLCPL
ncbi:MAG: hypothetical protein ACLTBV_00385 [Enterocloster bolteae]